MNWRPFILAFLSADNAARATLEGARRRNVGEKAALM
jgi:hypothetical protein